MQEIGLYNPSNGIAAIGFTGVSRVNYNLLETRNSQPTAPCGP
jgi:phosphoenolpyruvate carboxykinase (ATP)